MINFCNSFKNPKFKFADNFYKMIIFPVVAIVLAIVFLFTIGINKSYELKGGVVATMVVQNEVDINQDSQFKNIKSKIEEILDENKVISVAYQKSNVLGIGNTIIVKIDSLNVQDRDALCTSLKNDFKTELSDVLDLAPATLDEYLVVEPFEGVGLSETIITVLLATLIGLILVAVYFMFRVGVSAGINVLLMTISNALFALALLVDLRIPFASNTFAIVPIIALATILIAYQNYTKVKDVLADSEDNRKATNNTLANLVVSKNIFKIIICGFVAILTSLLLGSFNVIDMRLVALAIVISVVATIYGMTFVSPKIWALFNFKRISSIKPIKEEKPTEKLDETILTNEVKEEDIVRN